MHYPASAYIRENEQPRIIIGDDRMTLVNVRVNQGEFRKRLLKRYEGCCPCGLRNPELLIASHIRPWKNSEGNAKVDAENGLLLCPNHDKLFDKGFITFSDDGEIMISKKLSENDRALTNIIGTERIVLSETGKKYMQFHRNMLFKD